MAKPITLPPGGDLAQLYDMYNLAMDLMEEHGLKPNQPGGWKFQWSRTKDTAGLVDWGKETILFSAPLHSIWTLEQSRDNILHEIAHVLVKEETGSNQKHNAVWKKKFIEIGGSGHRTWGKLGEKTIPPKWLGLCPNGHEFPRHRKPSKRLSCDLCAGGSYWNPKYEIEWKEM